jgi:ADP-heptose:LPS heptosyltransferase
VSAPAETEAALFDIRAGEAPDHLLYVDIPSPRGTEARMGVSETLSVIGWAVAAAGVDSIVVAVDGNSVIEGRHGLRRPDVAAAHPRLPDALLSGYIAQLPPKALTPGDHLVTVTLRDRKGGTTAVDFRVVVDHTASARGKLRRQIPLAELQLKRTLLPAKARAPRFVIVLPFSKYSREGVARARTTLESLGRQVYESWRLWVLSTADHPRELRDALIAGNTELAKRLTIERPRGPQTPAPREWFVKLMPGDELGCDALLELALACRRTPEADSVYSDSRLHFQLSTNDARRLYCTRLAALADAEDPIAAADVLTPEPPEGVQCVYPSRPLFDSRTIRHIAIVKLDHIGDSVAALAAVHRLKHHFPRARLTILAGRACLPLWKAQPVVDDVLEFNFFHERSSEGKLDVSARHLQQLGQRLQPLRFDLAIDLRKQPDTRHVLRSSGARVLAGFDFQGRFPWLDIALEWDEDVPLRDKRSHVSDDLVALVERVHLQGSPVREEKLQPPKSALPLKRAEKGRLSGRPYLCLHPSAGSPMRQWPAKKFAQLIDLMVARHELTVVLVGSTADEPVSAQVVQAVEDRSAILDLTGRLQLPQLQALLAGAALFVGNNSGPHHIAAALGTFTIGIHSGVVDAREWSPTGPKAIAIRRDMSCSACYLERSEDCPRALACLTGLEATDVYNVSRDWIRNAFGTKRQKA